MAAGEEPGDAGRCRAAGWPEGQSRPVAGRVSRRPRQSVPCSSSRRPPAGH